MVAAKDLFGKNVFTDISRWAEPVVAAIQRDKAIAPLIQDAHFRKILLGISDRAYHLGFVEDSNPADRVNLTPLNEYSPRQRFGLFVALRQGNDVCGYVRHEIIDSFVRT